MRSFTIMAFLAVAIILHSNVPDNSADGFFLITKAIIKNIKTELLKKVLAKKKKLIKFGLPVAAAAATAAAIVHHHKEEDEEDEKYAYSYGYDNYHYPIYGQGYGGAYNNHGYRDGYNKGYGRKKRDIISNQYLKSSSKEDELAKIEANNCIAKLHCELAQRPFGDLAENEKEMTQLFKLEPESSNKAAKISLFLFGRATKMGQRDEFCLPVYTRCSLNAAELMVITKMLKQQL